MSISPTEKFINLLPGPLGVHPVAKSHTFPRHLLALISPRASVWSPGKHHQMEGKSKKTWMSGCLPAWFSSPEISCMFLSITLVLLPSFFTAPSLCLSLHRLHLIFRSFIWSVWYFTFHLLGEDRERESNLTVVSLPKQAEGLNLAFSWMFFTLAIF